MMLQESSYGIIPFRKKNDHWEVFLIQHLAGHWAFPKGHAERGEAAEEAAIRELLEETGFVAEEFLSSAPFIERYTYIKEGKQIDKTVTYFPALVSGEVMLQEEEIKEGKWVLLKEAHQFVTYSESKELCKKLQDAL